MINPCNVLDALADFQYDLMRRLNKKFEQLRRLAQLLEQLGDLSWLIPNINKLVPILDIDFSTYEQLAAACPFLGLSKTPVTGDLNALRQQVLAAYDNYARQLLNHPFMRMGKVQEELTRYQQAATGALSVGTSWIQCFQAMCGAASELSSTVSKIASTDIRNTVTTFTKNFVTDAGNILTDPMKAKYTQAKDALTAVRNVGSSVGQDYTAIKASASAVAATATGSAASTTSNSTNVYRNAPFSQ